MRSNNLLFLLQIIKRRGHGRRGRNFYSPSDTGLYFSLILPNPSHDILKIGLLTTSTAVAVVKVLEQFYKD